MLRVMQTARSFLFFAPTGSALSHECEVHVPEIKKQCNRSPREVYQIVLRLKNSPDRLLALLGQFCRIAGFICSTVN
jgi:hypothetical protein